MHMISVAIVTMTVIITGGVLRSTSLAEKCHKPEAEHVKRRNSRSEKAHAP